MDQLKCRDCQYYRKPDWGYPQPYCDITKLPTSLDSPACISIIGNWNSDIIQQIGPDR